MDNCEKKKMEGDDGLRTVESLRGRLQAERAASSAAKRDAELMDNKFKEVERQLKLEIRARRRQEKRLNSLKKKLESLNLVYTPSCNSEESDRQSSCNSENNCGESRCISSTASSGGFKEFPEEEFEVEFNDKSGNNRSETLVWGNVEAPEDKTSSSGLIQESPIESNSDDDHSMKSCSVMEMGNKKEDEDYYVDNTMALVVPAVMPPGEDGKQWPNKEEAMMDTPAAASSSSENVREILDTLKQIRERLQSSIGERRRHMIKVG